MTGIARSDAGGSAAGLRYPLETSVPGMFAVGDVRSDSAKRVAAAVGDDAAVVAQIHAYLSQPAKVAASFPDGAEDDVVSPGSWTLHAAAR